MTLINASGMRPQQDSPMWPYHPELLARPVPRYTSYPTAVEFSPSVGAEAQLEALQRLPRGTGISLYAHIPFCKIICWYCGCNTHRANKPARVENYLEVLQAEIDWLAGRVGGRVRLDRLSFGGGSPNSLEPAGFVRLVGQIISLFGNDRPEISVELDPRTFEGEWRTLLGKVGISRASFGVQTLEPDVQKRVGRIQPLEMIVEGTKALRDSGVRSLNFDLMYGLPGQTTDHLLHTIDQALELGPDRIALFGYAHVPQQIPRQRQIDAHDLPGMEERFRSAALGHARLVAAGYQAVGFDHFAKPDDPMAVAARNGTLRRNFQGFTDDQSEVLLGVGATAITCTPELILQNEKNLGQYRELVAEGLPPATLGVRRTTDDRERGLIIEELLCGRAADLSVMAENGLVELRLQPFLRHGLCTLADNRLQVTSAGLPYARAIASCFDRYRNHPSERFSNAI